MDGLPKINEYAIPLRSIGRCMSSVCHPQRRFLVNIVNPQTVESSSYVVNSKHLEKLIQGTTIHSKRMVKLDVVSLLTIVLTDEAITVV